MGYIFLAPPSLELRNGNGIKGGISDPGTTFLSVLLLQNSPYYS